MLRWQAVGSLLRVMGHNLPGDPRSQPLAQVALIELDRFGNLRAGRRLQVRHHLEEAVW